MIHHFSMPKAYSYTRFSTPEQLKGDSLRRQTEQARRYAEAHGLILDDGLSYADLGVSAFKGGNLAKGSGLGDFKEAIAEGLVEPGSVLLVESLDRLSRLPARKATRQLEDIVDAGVAVVTLSDGQRYDLERLEAEPMSLMVAYMVAMRAHEESQTKGRRVAAAWEEKRRKARAGEAAKFTLRAPAWLRWDGAAWQVDEDKAAIVRRVYELTLAGVGEHRIAERFNREGVPPFGRGSGWHRSAISKLLRNRAVLGELVPGRIEYSKGKRKRVLQEPIAGAYPAIISEADWSAVRSLKDGHAAPPRGTGAARPLANVLAGLARCPVCHKAMTRVFKGSGSKGGKPKLLCTTAKAGGDCVYRTVPLDAVEAAIFANVEALLADVPAGEAAADLDRRAASLANDIAGTVEHMGDLADALQAAPSNSGAERLACLEAELGTLEAALAALEEERRLRDGGLIRSRAERLQMMVEAARGEGEGFTDREPVNAALKVLFDRVTVDYPSGLLLFDWRQGGQSEIRYAWPGPEITGEMAD